MTPNTFRTSSPLHIIYPDLPVSAVYFALFGHYYGRQGTVVSPRVILNRDARLEEEVTEVEDQPQRRLAALHRPR